MECEDLHKAVMAEMGEATGQASYDEALLKVIAPLLHSHETEPIEGSGEVVKNETKDVLK